MFLLSKQCFHVGGENEGTERSRMQSSRTSETTISVWTSYINCTFATACVTIEKGHEDEEESERG